MTNDLNDMASATQTAGRTLVHGSATLGRGPVVAATAVAAVLIAVLIAGGFSAAGAMTAPRAATSEAPQTPDTGDESPVTDDPSTPPDRDSDQTEVTPPADTIYSIREGDTLTALSAQFGMSIDSIAAYNAVRDVNVISAGAVLRVPFIYLPPTEVPPAAVLPQ